MNHPIDVKLPVSVMIMTQNEELNIRFAVESVLPYFDQVIVADSFSTDGTLEVLKGYPGVEVYSNRFQGWAEQRNWMLRNCKINNEKVFFLDADEYITPEFVAELCGKIDLVRSCRSMLVLQRLIFMGKPLRFAYGHPKIGRLFSRDVTFVGAGAREYAILPGSQGEIVSPIMHHDRKPPAFWFKKHASNADREAAAYISGKAVPGGISPVSSGSLKRLWIRDNIWNRLPLLVRPFAYFTYRYFFKLGFLDGLPGLAYCFLQAFLYQMMIDIRIIRAKFS